MQILNTISIQLYLTAIRSFTLFRQEDPFIRLYNQTLSAIQLYLTTINPFTSSIRKNPFNKLSLTATQTIRFFCGLGNPGRDTLRSRTPIQRDLRSHEPFGLLFLRKKRIFTFFNKLYNQTLSAIQLYLTTINPFPSSIRKNSFNKLYNQTLSAIKVYLTTINPFPSSIRKNSFNKLYNQTLSTIKLSLTATQTIRFFCGLGNPGRDTLRSSTALSKGFTQPELFGSFFAEKKEQHPFTQPRGFYSTCLFFVGFHELPTVGLVTFFTEKKVTLPYFITKNHLLTSY